MIYPDYQTKVLYMVSLYSLKIKIIEDDFILELICFLLVKTYKSGYYIWIL